MRSTPYAVAILTTMATVAGCSHSALQEPRPSARPARVENQPRQCHLPRALRPRDADLVRRARRALGKQPAFTGALQPELRACEKSVTVIVPYVALDGTGDYAKRVTYGRAVSTFSSYVRTLFDKVDPLKRMTFVGEHRGKELLRVTLDREQYARLNLRHAEETLGAFQGSLIGELLAKKITIKEVEAKVARKRRKVYGGVFSRMPASQVSLHASLR